MSIRMIMENALTTWLLSDASLSHGAVRVRLALRDLRPRSYAEISSMTGMSAHCITLVVRELINAGWAVFTDSARRRPRLVSAVFPAAVEAAMASAVSDAYAIAPFQGEWLMRAKLDIYIGSVEYADNARPSWLVNVVTGVPMELDRAYPQLGLAFEYQGSSHHEPAATNDPWDNRSQHERSRSYKGQVERDAQKHMLCNRQGIRLVEVTALMLELEATKLIPDGIAPLSHYSRVLDSPLILKLNELCSTYAKKNAART